MLYPLRYLCVFLADLLFFVVDMAAVGDKIKTPEEVIGQVSELMRHDMLIMQENADKIGAVPDDSKVEGNFYDGKKMQHIRFNKVWSGHEFTKDELDLLFHGHEIEITARSKSGKPFKARGRLAEQEYKGKTFWGFKAELVPEEQPDKVNGVFTAGKNKGKAVSFKKSWGGHTFTEDEIRILLAGKTITFDAVSKGGKEYMVSGQLKQQTYKGHKFWGFKADF